ncbi:MAG TPA: hypothetical protein VHQ66_14270, partial [Myxococcota bacterium]|nr:hypothetical protein [Myxococcota bacterium]
MTDPRLCALACALLAVVSAPAAAFNPSPRPAPEGVDLVCLDDRSVSCTPNDTSVCRSGICVLDRSDLVPFVTERAELMLVTDEDVTGWDEGADASPDRER